MRTQNLVTFESQHLRTKEVPPFKAGDTVAVWVKIQEGTDEKSGAPKFRLQPFEGVVIRFRRGTTNSTFLVRKMSSGVAVEKNFFLHSPLIDRIELKARGRVRRSRIYYLRELRGKSARISNRFVQA